MSFLLKPNSHHLCTFTSPLQQTLSQIHHDSHNCNCTAASIQRLLNELLLETEWSESILIWLFVSIKFIRSFLKLYFFILLFFSNDSPCNLHLQISLFFLRFFHSERRHLVFSFVHFKNKIVKPKCKTPFSKLLKVYICYILLI